MKFFIKIFTLLLLFLIMSCYITPGTENGSGDISFKIPVTDFINKSVPYGTAGFEVIIAGGSISDPYNITEDDSLVFYYKDIPLASNVLTEWGGEEYEIVLNDVPEGDNLFMVIKYKTDDVTYNATYGVDVGTYGYFITVDPFSVKNGETTYINLITVIEYTDPTPAA